MNNTINNPKEYPVIVTLSVKNILRNVYATSALAVAGRITPPDHYQLLDEDHRPLLNTIVLNGFVNTVLPFAGYVRDTDISQIDDDILSLEVMKSFLDNAGKMKLFQAMVEQGIVLYVLSQVFSIEEGMEDVAQRYHEDFYTQISRIAQYLSLN